MNSLRDNCTGRISSPYPEDEGNLRYCPECERWLPFGEFYKDARTRSGLTRRCRTHHIKGSYRSREKNPQFASVDKRYEYNRNRLLAKYGLTQEKYEALWESQGKMCAICNRTDMIGNGWVIDHDHSCCPNDNKKKCGRCTRGILCTNCNTALGKLQDDPRILVNALTYLTARANP